MDVLFEERQKTGQSDANGVGAWRQLFARENAFGVRQEQVSGYGPGCFGKNGDSGAQLRDTACITHLA